mmetsp:Transcript_8807/g.18713  ORF Transcript_8807/g.18713 Transcript_8807/m.18713 type:complete len:141 (+) Transcript_8807:594-1016(+)
MSGTITFLICAGLLRPARSLAVCMSKGSCMLDIMKGLQAIISTAWTIVTYLMQMLRILGFWMMALHLPAGNRLSRFRMRRTREPFVELSHGRKDLMELRVGSIPSCSHKILVSFLPGKYSLMDNVASQCVLSISEIPQLV